MSTCCYYSQHLYLDVSLVPKQYMSETKLIPFPPQTYSTSSVPCHNHEHHHSYGYENETPRAIFYTSFSSQI